MMVLVNIFCALYALTQCAVNDRRPTSPEQKSNSEKIKNELTALEFDVEYQALINRYICQIVLLVLFVIPFASST